MQYCREVLQVVVLQQHYQFHTAQELLQARLTNAGTIFFLRAKNSMRYRIKRKYSDSENRNQAISAKHIDT